MKFKFEEGGSEYILKSFGLSIDEQGFVVKDGERVVDFRGNIVKADDLLIISEVEDGDELYLVQDDFLSRSDYKMMQKKKDVSVDDYAGKTYSSES